MQGSFLQQPQRRRRELGRSAEALVRLDVQTVQDHVPHGGLRQVTPPAHQAVADRSGVCGRIPAHDQLAVAGALGVILQAVGIQYCEQPLAPTRQEHGTIVQLDAQHICGPRRCVDRQQVVTDLGGPRAEVVLRAKRGSRGTDRPLLARIGGHARVGGPDASHGRINRHRMSGFLQPACGAIRPPVAFSDRYATINRPADVSLPVAHNKVLVRYPNARRQRQRLLNGAHVLQAQQIEVAGLRHLGEPGSEPAPTLARRLQEHPSGPPANREPHTRCPMDLYFLPAHREGEGSRGALQRGVFDGGAGDRRDIQPLSITVGEAPGDVSVRARDHDGRAGKCHAGQIDALVDTLVDILVDTLGHPRPNAHPIPDHRYALAEVHVVGDQSRPGSGVASCDRPVVAPYDRVRQSDVSALRRRLAAPQVEDIGPRNARAL